MDIKSKENIDFKENIAKISNDELLAKLDNIKYAANSEIDFIIEEIKKRNLDFCYKVKKNSFINLSIFAIIISLIILYLIVLNIIIDNMDGVINSFILLFFY